ncbi:unnamed protein product [Dovyalis caffra]|uniref:Uncharacterized protein n=1 Tax=Dovyalis caffra TaxID=77055 RepID=A0AAV1SUF4_9ROSI|nr:unnamed protein product [Dovyalis caffra]
MERITGGQSIRKCTSRNSFHNGRTDSKKRKQTLETTYKYIYNRKLLIGGLYDGQIGIASVALALFQSLNDAGKSLTPLLPNLVGGTRLSIN